MIFMQHDKTSFLENRFLELGFLFAAVLLLKSVYLSASAIWRVDLFYYIEAVRTILDGGVLYKNFGDSHPPLSYFTYYVLAKIFGYNSFFFAIKTASIIFDFLCAGCVLLIFEKKYSSRIAFAGALVFLFMVNADYQLWPFNIPVIILLPLFAALYFLLKNNAALAKRDLFIAGFFIACASLVSTNVIFYSLMVPFLSYNKKRSFKELAADGTAAFCGFMVPLACCFIYFYRHDALADWYFWNITWGSTYSAAHNPLAKILMSFAGFFKIWQWLPFVLAWFASVFIIIKKRLYKDDVFAFAVCALFVCALLSRLIMGKTVERYVLYALPSVLFSSVYVLNRYADKVTRLVSAGAALFCAAALCVSFVSGIRYPDDKIFVNRSEMRSWILSNTLSTDTIYVWDEGYEIYFYTKRKMATRIFSAGEYIDKSKLWKANDYKNTAALWDMFLADFTMAPPAYLIDLTPNFAQSNGHPRIGIHLAKYNKFTSFVAAHYAMVCAGSQGGQQYRIFKKVR